MCVSVHQMECGVAWRHFVKVQKPSRCGEVLPCQFHSFLFFLVACEDFTKSNILSFFPPSVAKDCGFLDIPVNGSLVGLNVTTFPNSLIFACDKGFILKGSRVRHCQANAIWSGNETFCQGEIIKVNTFIYCLLDNLIFPLLLKSWDFLSDFFPSTSLSTQPPLPGYPFVCIYQIE